MDENKDEVSYTTDEMHDKDEAITDTVDSTDESHGIVIDTAETDDNIDEMPDDEINSHLVSIDSLPDEKPKVQIRFKPMTTIIGCLIIGVVFIVTQLLWMLGVFLLVIAGLVMWLVKERKVLDAYDDRFVVYLEKDPENCLVYTWSEVVEWSFVQGNADDRINFVCRDGSYDYIKTLTAAPLLRCFNKYIPDKQDRKRKEAAEKEAQAKQKPKRKWKF